jgi:hypothetical protein
MSALRIARRSFTIGPVRQEASSLFALYDTYHPAGTASYASRFCSQISFSHMAQCSVDRRAVHAAPRGVEYCMQLSLGRVYANEISISCCASR